MLYCDDWERRRERHMALWENEVIDRACISVKAPIGNWQPESLPQDPKELEKYWTDGEWILQRFLDECEHTYFAGDSYPSLRFNLGAAGHAGFFKGVGHEFRDTVWFFPNEALLQDERLPEFDEEAFLYKKTLELADYLSSEAKGDFVVSMPDISGNIDALAHIISSTRVLELFYEDPEYIERALDVIQQVYIETCRDCFDIFEKNRQKGNSIGWMYTYCEGKHMQMQSDLSVMVSPQMFDDFLKKELEEQAAFLEYGVYHLDGQEQRRHLDSLLSIDGIRMIQWTSVAGQPKPIAYLDSLKKIQSAGKGLLLMPSPEEVPELIRNLSAKGLYLVVKASTPEEADAVVQCVEKESRLIR
ncbi:MAG: hypothetical protein ACOX1U_01655 [Saccharofermentanales bacterium]|jgi:hypothetical protein|nr:hypothetical protein [Clostridiaceae bacterium]